MMKNDTRQGYFATSQTQDNATTSSIGTSVSMIGVPQSAQDLATYEHQLVVQSIKQDLRAALQRQAPTHADVDLTVFMQHGAPRELKDILQGLVYVAKIKDVANTRGGAQVSQHRRVLAQQTYNMLVQELGDMLQGQAVQRKLRDLANASDHRSQHNKSEDRTVQSTVGLSALPGGMGQNMPNLSASASNDKEIKSEDDRSERGSERGSSVVGSVLGELTSGLDPDYDDKTITQDKLEIEQARQHDEARMQQKISMIQGNITEEDNSEQRRMHQQLLKLNVVSDERKKEFERYDNEVKTHYENLTNFRKRIEEIKSTTGTVNSAQDIENLTLDMFEEKERLFNFHKDQIKAVKNKLEFLRNEEDTLPKY